MIALVPATGRLLEGILDGTYAIWNDGLSRERYARWNEAQLRTRWGADHLGRWALVENGQVLASAKRYDFDATLSGRPVGVLGIGAVFTPPDRRGHGFARLAVERLCDAASEQGAGLALLFSEIGADYYARLGFTVVPVTGSRVTVREKPGAPAALVRTGHDDDLAAIAAMQDPRAEGCRFALRRDADYIAYAITRKRLLAGMGAPGARTTQVYVTEEGGRAVAYVVLTIANGEWALEECGDRDPTGARLGAMLQVLLAREPAGLRPAITGWLPPGFAPPQLTIEPVPEPAVVMMLKPLAAGLDVSGLSSGNVLYWRGDVF